MDEILQVYPKLTIARVRWGTVSHIPDGSAMKLLVLPAQFCLGVIFKKLTCKSLQNFPCLQNPSKLIRHGRLNYILPICPFLPARLLQSQQESPCPLAKRGAAAPVHGIRSHGVDPSAEERQHQRQQAAWCQGGHQLPRALVQARGALGVGQVAVRAVCLKVAGAIDLGPPDLRG